MAVLSRLAGLYGFIGFLMSRDTRWHGRMMTHPLETGNAGITRGTVESEVA